MPPHSDASPRPERFADLRRVLALIAAWFLGRKNGGDEICPGPGDSTTSDERARAGRDFLRESGSFGISATGEVWTGGLLIVGMLAFGGLIAHDRGPTALDQLVIGHLPHVRGTTWTGLVHLSSPFVLVPAVLVSAAWSLRQGLRPAVVCVLAPLVAVLAAQVLKHVFNRLDSEVASYPSGTVAAVAAVAAVAVIAVDRRWRPFVALGGALLLVTICLTVVALRWHYPTDAIGGAALSVGVVMMGDGLTTMIPKVFH